MRSADRESFRHRTVLPRFRDAARGIYEAYREEPNLRFHVFALTCLVVLGLAAQLDPWEGAYLAITAAAVLFAEMVNSAVERAVDFAAAGRRHPLAGQAKEMAAGAVLLTALHALFAAYWIFIYNRGVLESILALTTVLRAQPWLAALPVLAGLLGLFGGAREGR